MNLTVFVYFIVPPSNSKKSFQRVPSVWVRVGHFRAGFENWFSPEITIYERKSQIFKKFSDGSELFEFEGRDNKVNKYGNWRINSSKKKLLIYDLRITFFLLGCTVLEWKSMLEAKVNILQHNQPKLFFSLCLFLTKSPFLFITV